MLFDEIFIKKHKLRNVIIYNYNICFRKRYIHRFSKWLLLALIHNLERFIKFSTRSSTYQPILFPILKVRYVQWPQSFVKFATHTGLKNWPYTVIYKIEMRRICRPFSICNKICIDNICVFLILWHGVESSFNVLSRLSRHWCAQGNTTNAKISCRYFT